jgi:hypothetical protein
VDWLVTWLQDEQMESTPRPVVGWLAGLRLPGLTRLMEAIVAVTIRLTPTCVVPTTGDGQIIAPGVRRFRTQGPAGTPQVVDVFPGACLSYQPEPGIGPSTRLLDQAQRAVAFRIRDGLREALRHRSGGRLQLDPEGGN